MFTSSFPKQRTRLQFDQLEGRAAPSTLATNLPAPNVTAFRPEIALVRVADSGQVAHSSNRGGSVTTATIGEEIPSRSPMADHGGAEAFFAELSRHAGEEIPQ